MHASSVDLSFMLAGPNPTANIFVPTPNHDHVVDNSRVNTQPIWWEVRPVLIMNQSDWPAADGSSGITSASEMDAAENAGRAVEVGSNFFLFFSSQLSSRMALSSPEFPFGSSQQLIAANSGREAAHGVAATGQPTHTTVHATN
jgi:hypothetical protein